MIANYQHYVNQKAKLAYKPRKLTVFLAFEPKIHAMTKAYYAIIFLVTALGLLLGYLVAPSDSEVALMNLEDKRFEQAFHKYQRLYAQGDHSVRVVMPLSKLYLQYGDIESAIVLMERFINKNPKDEDAYAQLGVFYQYAQRPDDYLRNLEERYRLQPNAVVLRELSKIYNFHGNYEKQVKILEELLRFPDKEIQEQDYVNLAYLYGSVDRYDESLKVVERLLKRKEKLELKTMELAVSLLLDANRLEKALKVTRAYLKGSDSISDAVMLSTRFSSKNYLKEAYGLLEPLQAYADTNPQLLSEMVTIQISLGNEKEVFDNLLKRFEKGNLPESALDTMVSLALDYGDLELLERITELAPLRLLSEEVLLGFAEAAIRMEQPDLASEVQRKLGEAFLNIYPLLASVFDLATSPKSGGAKRINKDQMAALTNIQKLMLVRIYNEAGYLQEALAILKKIPLLDAMDRLSPSMVARMFLDLGQAKEGLKLLNKERNKSHFITRVDHAWLLLSAAIGDDKSVMSWLKKRRKAISNQLVADAYFMTVQYKKPKLALILAKRMYSKHKTIKNRMHLARALVLGEKYAKALGHLKQLVPLPREAEGIYLQSLAGLAKQYPDKPTHKADLNRFLNQMLGRPGLASHEKRQIGFVLADINLLAQAEKIFFELAELADPESADVAQLVYLWGKDPGLKRKYWLTARAALSGKSPKTQSKWLEYLIFLKEHRLVVDLVAASGVELEGEVADWYIEALVVEKNTKKLLSVLERQVKQEHNVKRLKELAGYASAHKLEFVARQALEKMERLAPEDPHVIRELALTHYYKGHFKDAKPYLRRAVQVYPKDYRLLYYLGEVLWQAEDTDEAEGLFARAQTQITTLANKNLDAHLMELSIWQRQGKLDRVRRKFEVLIGQYPKNKDIRSDYASFLMELGEFDEAGKVLGVAR